MKQPVVISWVAIFVLLMSDFFLNIFISVRFFPCHRLFAGVVDAVVVCTGLLDGIFLC